MRKTIRIASSFLLGTLFWCQTALATTNSVTITEEDGITTANYPIQLGRPFVKGEIANYPQAIINGTPVTTQADVKQRFPDGSVKHAILTFYIPSLVANSTVTVTFQDQASGNNTGFLDDNAMLGAGFDFNAIMELTNGTTKSASARTMLQAGDYTYWMQGTEATSIILADHSIDRTYDIGFDSYNPFRPIFHATFFPTINKVRIRFIGENSNSEEFEDVNYDLNLKTGNTSPASVYTKSSMIHTAGSRWTKEYWIGGKPSTISINHNLNYLAETRAVPNYDSTHTFTENQLSYFYSQFQATSRDLYDLGSINYKAMAVGGSHSEIGPLPTWTVRWLYTGDYRDAEEALTDADLSAAWPMHIRENDSTKKLLRNNANISGLGFPITTTGRPTTCLATDLAIGQAYSYTEPQDQINYVGTHTSQSWNPDCAHQPDYYSPQFLLTGDYWYLEQMQFWTSWSANYFNGAAYNLDWGRGPTGMEGGIVGNIREQAWPFRNRVMTEFNTPDGDPYKDYLKDIINDQIALWEGQRNITGTAYQSDPTWAWGKQHMFDKDPMGLPPLHQWERGNSAFAQADYGIDTSVVKEGVSNFESMYLTVTLGRAKELGHAVDSLLASISKYYIGVLTDPGCNPYLVGNGRTPTVKKNGTYFNTFTELVSGYNPTWQAKQKFTPYNGEDYEFLACAAVSYLYCYPGGSDAWGFLDTAAAGLPQLDNDPKWDIMPRMCPIVTSVAQPKLSGTPWLKVFPNPSTGAITLSASDFNAAATVDVINMLGQSVYSTTITKFNGQHNINLQQLNRGIYMVRVMSGKEHFETKITLTE